MPFVDKQRGSRLVRVYFDKEEDRSRYQDYTPTESGLSQAYDKRRIKANVLKGDRDCLKVYQNMYDSGKWSGDYTPKQIREIYQHAL